MRTRKRFKVTSIMATITAIIFLLGGCMSEKDAMNKPLPRMSQEHARQWAKHFTESMARSANVKVTEKSMKPEFNRCVGKGNETPEDGRFILDHYTRAPVPVSEHFRAVGRVRDDLKKNGYKIETFQKAEGKNQYVTLEASSPRKGFTVSVEGDHSEDSLRFTVSTPCLMPPGKKQKQY